MCFVLILFFIISLTMKLIENVCWYIELPPPDHEPDSVSFCVRLRYVQGWIQSFLNGDPTQEKGNSKYMSRFKHTNALNFKNKGDFPYQYPALLFD